MNFSDNLIKLRKTKGWSQEDLADKLSLSRQAISKWEVGTSKPDIDNLINLSKLFKVSIDQLVNNEIIVTEAVSFDVKKNDKKKKVLTLLKRLFIVLAIIYVVNVIYNFAVLFTITQAELKYKELDNYHYIITTYDNEGLREKEECWFKDGVSKTVNTTYMGSNKQENITCVDFNKKICYMIKSNYTDKININFDEFLNNNKMYDKGAQLYSRFPTPLKKQNIANLLAKSIDIVSTNINFNDNNILISIDNKNINIQKNELKPYSYYLKDKITQKYRITYFEIQLGELKSLQI